MSTPPNDATTPAGGEPVAHDPGAVNVTQHIVDDLAEVAEPLAKEADARLRLRWLKEI